MKKISKKCYLQGDSSGDYHPNLVIDEYVSGYNNFAVIHCKYFEIDCLLLNSRKNISATLCFDAVGNLTGDYYHSTK